jgi:hypothetical protein
MKRKLFWTVAVVLWAALVACYWRGYVPLRPLTSISFANNVEPVGWTAHGDVVVCPTLNWPEIVSNEPNFGPVQVWRFPAGRLVRELFTPDDVIQFDDFRRSGEITSIRDGQWSLFNASTGEMAERIPVAGMVDSYRRIPDSNLIIFSEGNVVRCYDTARDTFLWTAEGFRNVSKLGPDFVVAGKAIREPHGWVSGTSTVALSLKDGQPVSRFDHLGPISWLVPSPDGRLAAAYYTRQKKFAMCDALTGEVRWTGAVTSPPMSYGFDEVGRFFRTAGRERNGDSVVLRWDVDDGTHLEAEVTHRTGERWRNRDPQHRFVIESEDANVGIEASIRRALFKTPFSGLAPPFLDRTWLIEVETDRNLGLVATGRRSILRTPDEKGVLVFAGKHVDYFPFPPQRNWRWLILWSSLPPVCVWLALRAIKGLRGRRCQRRMQTLAASAT